MRLCLSSELLSVKDLSHSTHLYVLPVWVTKCLLRPEAWQNAFGQSWQWCNWISFGFSFWCLRMCTFSASRCVKLFSQCWHWNGFWPEWVIRWRNKISFCAKARWQMLQPNGFSPASTDKRMYIRRISTTNRFYNRDILLIVTCSFIHRESKCMFENQFKF